MRSLTLNWRCRTLALCAATLAALAPQVSTAQASSTQASSTQATGRVDYTNGDNWLCRPGREDACAIDLSATVVHADGTLEREATLANPLASIDCFYVYPTVSTDAGSNSDMTPNEPEIRVVAQQFARFASVCRTYAPSYRQVTLLGLRQKRVGGVPDLATGVAYDDVLEAFRYYLENDNDGRGFVLIGHSQGSYILTRLIAEEIDAKPVQRRLVSALLLGAAVTVARGSDVGGSFTSVPLCSSATQTGCVIAYSAFRSTAPPPDDTLFGSPPDDGHAVACVNPASLAGGSAELHAYLSTTGTTIVGRRPVASWVEGGAPIETPFVSVPGLLTAECATNEHATYLEITVNGNPADPRVDDIVGDLTPQWGLHLVDVNLSMGNLIDIVRQQRMAYRGGR